MELTVQIVFRQKGFAFERKEETEDEFNVELFQTKAQHVMVKLNS